MNKQTYILSIVLFGFLISFLPSSAQVQHGYVKTRGRLAADGAVIAGQRLNGATISIKGKGNVVSKNNGKANGTFSFNMPGKTFCLTNVQKNGYQLCDHDLIGNPFQHSANDLIVVMDTPENALQDKLTSEKKIRRTLQRQLQEKENELEALKEQQKISLEEYRKQLQELYAAQENNEKLIADMAERYSTLDFDQLDEFQRRVAAFIQNGELTRADSLLNTKGSMEERSKELDRMDAAIKTDAEDLAKRQQAHEQSMAMKAKALEDFAADCFSRYEICKMQHKNDSAAYWLKLRASKDTMNVDWQLEAGDYICNFMADYDQALGYFQTGLNATVSQYEENSISLASCYAFIGGYHYFRGYYTQALDYYQKALGIQLGLLGEAHSEVAISYNNIGLAYYALGEYDKAIEFYQKAILIFSEEAGENQCDIASGYNNLGLALNRKGDFNQALDYYQKALKIQSEVLGQNHPNISVSLVNIGYIYYSKQKYSDAMDYYQKALDIQKEVLGKEHPLISSNYNNMGVACCALGDIAKALEYFQEAMAIQIHLLGENHPDIATTYHNIGFAYYVQQNYTQALVYYQKALNILLEALGANNLSIASCYNNIGAVYSAQNDFQNALIYCLKALDIRLGILNENHPDLANNYSNAGVLSNILEDYDDALTYFQKALKIQLEIYGEINPEIAASYQNIAENYEALYNYPKALEYHQKALNTNKALFEAGHPDIASSYEALGKLYLNCHSQGIDLKGFQDFIDSTAFIAIINGDNSPAAKIGLSGEYYVLEFNDWTIDSDNNLFQKNKELKGQPKTIIVMQNDNISQYHFESTIGASLDFKGIGMQEKQRIISAYHKWKEMHR